MGSRQRTASPPHDGSTSSFRLRLADPVDGASIALFRVVFGILIVWEAWRYFSYGWIEHLYLRPKFLFTYPGFGWIEPWPGIGLHLHFFAIGVLGALVAVGIWCRAACLLLCGALWYVILLDQAAYLNHLYLAALLAGLLGVVPSGRAFSVDAFRQADGASSLIPVWWLWLLRFQIALPYVFGGIAKLNPDWLAGQPMGLWVSRMAAEGIALPLLDAPGAGRVMSYLALGFDLGIVPALCWQPTRRWAFAVAVVFHVMNAVMFRIGIFPWLMIAATTLFFAPNWPRRFMSLVLKDSTDRASGIPSPMGPTTPMSRRGLWFAAAWMIVQMVLPVRHWNAPGRVDWNEQGSRFAWRMMVRDKASVLQIVIVDRETGDRRPFDPRQVLTPQQIERMGQYPDMLRQFSEFLAESLARPGAPLPEVRILCLVSFNGRKPQRLVEDVNLADVPRGEAWISPLVQPLPSQPWLVPLRDWALHVTDEAAVAPRRDKDLQPSR